MQDLSDLDVLVVDCQTTGASPAHGAVLEIGWGVARASAPDVAGLEAHWVTLPPGHFITSQVRRLTGFDEADVTSTLDPTDAWMRLRATAGSRGPTPTAIHFAKFELAFLRDWSMRFEPSADFPLDAVCLHAIACRLYPDLPRRSIRALAGFLGHGVDLTRRCMGHVEATAFIWRSLVTELASRGVTTWDALGDWLAAPTPAGAPPRKRRYPIPTAKYRALPDEPGVYRFLRSNGDLLYVGKAASLRKRVVGHFTAGSSTTERALEMLTQVHDIQITPTQTALEAALLENEEIKSRHPPYNLQLLGGDLPTWFCNRELDGASTEPDDIHRYGPLPSTFSVRSYSAIFALVAGESPTSRLRARAVGAPERWAPDEATFAAGYAAFADRHALYAVDSKASVRRALVVAARKLILSARTAATGDVERNEADLDTEEADDRAASIAAWDPERVVRHLERPVMHAYQLLQRARWLCLLADSVVVFREPTSDHPRLLLVRAGQLVEARDLGPDEPVRVPATSSLPVRSRYERQATFDRGHYDRLRTLTTELKRVLRDRGSASVRVGRRWLEGRTLESLLLWV